MAEALVSMPLPKGNRVAIIGSGGQGVTISDNCELLGLKVPEFDQATKMQLKKSLPPHAPVPGNPVDFAGGNRGADDEAKVADALAQIPYIDGIITNMPSFRGGGGNASAAHAAIEGAEIVASIPKKYGKPVITLSWHSSNGGDIARDVVRGAGIPGYDTPEQVARAMYALCEYARIRRVLESES
jgi:acyl-CoA synthetase (NDP forming)